MGAAGGHDRAQVREVGAERKHPHADAHASEDAPNLGVDPLQEEVEPRERSLDINRGKDVGFLHELVQRWLQIQLGSRGHVYAVKVVRDSVRDEASP